MAMTRVFPAILVSVLAVTPAAAQSDEKKTATALLAEAARLEADGNPDKALEKAQKAAEKAAAEQRRDVAARALQIIGRCTERLTPDNLEAAQAAYAKIAGECGDVEPVAAWARDKVAWKGIDVWLGQYYDALCRLRDHERHVHARLAEWRAAESDPRVVELRESLAKAQASVTEQKAALWAKVQPLDKDAIPGLTAGLGHKDEVVRAVGAEFLAEVIDEEGIAALISKLSDEALRPGAALGLSRVFDKYKAAQRWDEEAARVMEDLADLKPVSEPESWIVEGLPEDTQRRMDVMKDTSRRGKELVTQGNEKAKALQAKAGEIRHNIPGSLDGEKIHEALRRVLLDESRPAGRVQAARALEAFEGLSGPVVDALLAGLSSPHRDVRLACCAAAGAVDTTRPEDKRRVADRLIAIVQYEPEVENAPDSDHANDPSVRAMAALSLGRIGTIQAIPALIDALGDNSPDVRGRANEALIAITGKDCGYESEPYARKGGADPSTPGASESEGVVRARQLEQRGKAIEAWKAWWDETGGIGTIVERFWRFVGAWKSGVPTRLFDKDAYLQEIRARAYAFSDPEDAFKRAERNVMRFQDRKAFLQTDAIEVGPSAVTKLLKYVSGKMPDMEKGLTKDLVDRLRDATRMFVGETIAKLAKDAGGDFVAALRDKVSSGGSRDERAGAALALGFLPRDMITHLEREVLDKRGLFDQDPIVREAAARALKNVGDESNAAGLAALATSQTPDNERAQVWALRALMTLRPKDAEVVKALGELVGFETAPGESVEKLSTSSLVREAACDALAAILEPTAVTELYLLRARRDLTQNVREAAQRAVRAIGGARPEIASAIVDVLDNKGGGHKAGDRLGAALALGDLGQEKYAVALVNRLIDENAPILLKDPDAAVRSAICRGLGIMGSKAKLQAVGDKLLLAMETDESEQTRQEAYAALRAIAGTELPAFEAAAPTETRKTQLTDLKSTWWGSARSSWKAGAE
ncbi:MAG: HEAT repeat domain-containing protein [Planctomycetes bacterium]|nr:HEAT repeat domain-containing protein [Planctomycetota bacterium]